MEKFFDRVFAEPRAISDILSRNVPMSPLTDVEQVELLSAHGLDCLHFPSLPSMTLQLALKVTDVERRPAETAKLISHPKTRKRVITATSRDVTFFQGAAAAIWR